MNRRGNWPAPFMSWARRSAAAFFLVCTCLGSAYAQDRSAVKEYIQFINIEGVGRIGPIALPGPRLKAILASGEEVPVWTQAQAAKIAVELAIREKIYTEDDLGKRRNRLVQLLTETVMTGQDEVEAEAGKYRLCLSSSSLRRPMSFNFTEKERRAIREDGVELLLFTPKQAQEMYATLLKAGLTVPEIAAAIAGFEVRPPGPADLGNAREIIISKCGTCTDGFVCDDLEEGCCPSGLFECRSCNLCARMLTTTLFP